MAAFLDRWRERAFMDYAFLAEREHASQLMMCWKLIHNLYCVEKESSEWDPCMAILVTILVMSNVTDFYLYLCCFFELPPN